MLENTIMQYFLLIAIGFTRFYCFHVTNWFNYNFLIRIVDCCGIFKCLLISLCKVFNICNIIEWCVGVQRVRNFKHLMCTKGSLEIALVKYSKLILISVIVFRRLQFMCEKKYFPNSAITNNSIFYDTKPS